MIKPMIDTHAHIYLQQFEDDLDIVLGRAQKEGVEQILMPNIDSSTIERMHEVEERWPDLCKSMMGLHPCSVDDGFEKQIRTIEEKLDNGQYVAVGEIGTDLYWDKTWWQQQQQAFIQQVLLAEKHNLPVVIHCRDSIDETIALLEKMPVTNHKGVFHCFTGSKSQGQRIIEMGYYLGIGGVGTFKNTDLRETLSSLGLSRLVLETDSPYLAPTPYRGKRNEPSYVKHVAEMLSGVFQCTINEVQHSTTKNAKDLFSL